MKFKLVKISMYQADVFYSQMNLFIDVFEARCHF